MSMCRRKRRSRLHRGDHPALNSVTPSRQIPPFPPPGVRGPPAVGGWSPSLDLIQFCMAHPTCIYFQQDFCRDQELDQEVRSILMVHGFLTDRSAILGSWLSWMKDMVFRKRSHHLFLFILNNIHTDSQNILFFQLKYFAGFFGPEPAILI